LAEIPTRDWSWIDEAAQRFERDWQKGPRPRIEDFLSDVAEPVQPLLLGELLRVERELRAQAGEGPNVDEYRRRFPDCDDVITSVFASVRPETSRASAAPTGGLTTIGTRGDGSKIPPELANHSDYEIIRELGRGGMGVVFLAHNRIVGRDEVLKVIGPDVIESPGVFDRFRNEIRAVARLQHPNIVTAHTAFRCGKSLVFSMEYVEGLDLARLVKAKGPVPVGHACYFVHQAALGLQHAHEAGMVHRDIKPNNLMLTRKRGKALIKVLDFGLAKAEREQNVLEPVPFAASRESSQSVGLTLPGEMLGTPDFIAPEQIADSQSADIRADIYSLGCTLYYLLSGRPPFPSSSMRDTLRAHGSTEAPLLNVVRPDVPAELAALVARMMAKKPELRFQTPNEVAVALAPFYKKQTARSIGANLGVDQTYAPNAGPPAVGAGAQVPATKTGMWSSLIDFAAPEENQDAGADSVKPAREQPGWLWPAVATCALLIALISAWASGVFHSKPFRMQSEPLVGSESSKMSIPVAAPEVMKKSRAVAASEPKQTSAPAVEPSPGKEAPTPTPDITTPAEALGGEITSIKSPDRVVQARLIDARHVLYETEGRNRALWSADLTDPKKPQTRKLESSGLSDWAHLVLASDGKFAVLAGKDKALWYWDLESGRSRRLRTGAVDLTAIALSPDNRLVAYVRSGAIRFGDAITGEQGKHKEFQRQIGSRADLIAFSPNGRRIVSTHADRALRLWDVETGRELGHTETGKLVTGLTVFPDGRRVLASFSDPTVGIWDLETSQQLRRFPSFGLSIDLAPDGRRALIGGENLMRLWDLETDEELMRENHQKALSHVAFSPDGRHAVSSTDESVRVWVLPPGRRAGEQPPVVEVAQLLGHDGILQTAVVSPDGRRVLTCGWPKTIRLWDRETCQQIRSFGDSAGGLKSVAFSPDGSRALSGGDDGVVRLWDVGSGEQKREFLPGHANNVFSVAFSPDGRVAYSAGGGVYRDTGLQDGTDFAVRVWDVNTGKQLPALDGHKGMVLSVAVSPDGRYVLSGGNDTIPILWNARTGAVIHRLRGHTGRVHCVAFLPDGRRAVSSGVDATIRLWDLESGQELSPHFTDRPVCNGWLAVSPDGHRLLASDGSGYALQFWNVDAGKLIQTLNLAHVSPTRGSFTPDGRHAVWSGWDGVVRMYRLAEPTPADRIADYTEGIRLNPDDALAHNNLGKSLQTQGKTAEAIAEFETAIRLKPEFADAHTGLAKALAAQKKLDAAITEYKTATRYDPAAAEPHVGVGFALRDQGKREEAIIELRIAIQLKPDHGEALNNLAWALVLPPNRPRPEYDEGLTHARKVVELAPDRLNLNTLALAEYRTGHWALSLAASKRSMALQKEVWAYDFFLVAMARCQNGDKDEARKWFDKAVAWTKANGAKNVELRQFWSEAAELLRQPGSPAATPGMKTP
jgi:WD40 repeat protein/serine/threonine protein kinase/Tfp pilus assembly protein PilF